MVSIYGSSISIGAWNSASSGFFPHQLSSPSITEHSQGGRDPVGGNKSVLPKYSVVANPPTVASQYGERGIPYQNPCHQSNNAGQIRQLQ